MDQMKTTDSERAKDEKRHIPIRWIVLAVVLVGLLAFVAFRAVQELQLHQRFEAIRAAGYPVTPQDLNRYYPDVPNSRNAALVYAQAFAKYDSSMYRSVDYRATKEERAAGHLLPLVENGSMPEGKWPPELLAHADEWLEGNAEALQLIRQAAAMPECRFPGSRIRTRGAPRTFTVLPFAAESSFTHNGSSGPARLTLSPM